METKSIDWKVGRTYQYTIHEHKARRAGLHYDVRIKRSDGKVESFASRKSPLELPKGGRRLLIRQVIHDPWWLKFEGEIEQGYGAGTLKIVDRGKAELVRIDDNEKNKVWVFDFKGQKLNDRYALVHLDGDNFILVRKKNP